MSWQALAERDCTARKTHKCIWCGETIAKGAKFHWSTGKLYGEFQCNAYHPECWTAALELFRSGEEEFGAGDFKRGTTEQK